MRYARAIVAHATFSFFAGPECRLRKRAIQGRPPCLVPCLWAPTLFHAIGFLLNTRGREVRKDKVAHLAGRDRPALSRDRSRRGVEVLPKPAHTQGEATSVGLRAILINAALLFNT